MMTSSRDKSKDNRRPSPAQVYEALHKKRAAEYEARTQWAGVTQYFKTWENNSNKFTNWTSPQYYKKSSELQMEIKKQEQKKLEEEQQELERWRKKVEDRQREDEEFRKGQMKKKPVSLSTPNSAGRKTPCEEMAMELKRKQDAVADREVELKLHARSKLCDPKLAKQYEMRVRERSSESSWDDRAEERKSADQKRRERIETERILSEERLKAERFADEEKHQSRQARADKLKNELIDQVAALKVRSDHCDKLKRQESTYLTLQNQLKNIELRNEQLEQRKIQSLSRPKALWQYLTMLKQRSKEILEFLREDIRLLDDLDVMVGHSHNVIDLSDRMNLLRETFRRYEDEESERLYLMDFMFEEEARNMWRSQEERWKSEHVIRKSGIEDLFAEIKFQLEEKIDKCLNEQRVLIGEREQLINVIEEGNNELKRLEAESTEFYKLQPNYDSQYSDPMAITNREQKLLAEMAQLNLLDDPKLMDHRRKKAVW